MPDQLTDRADAGASATGPGRRPALRRAGRLAAVLLLFVGVALAAGWLWERLWDAPTGIVADGTWFPVPYEEGQRADFDGTGSYVLIALAAGALAGLLCALFSAGSEVVTVVGVVVGSCLAGWVMATFGSSLSAPDPTVAARTAEDGARLAGHLQVRGASPYAAFPLGALLALLVVYLSSPGRRRR